MHRLTLLAVVFLGACGASAVPARDLSALEWHDDFLGANLRPEYSLQTFYAENTFVADRPGGWVEMRARGRYEKARMRLGDDPTDTSSVELNMPFFHVSRSVGRSRVVLDSDVNVHATVGYVGPDDPNGVGGAWLYRYEFGQGPTWMLQTCAESQCSNIRAEWKHTPGEPFELEVRLMPGRVEGYINGELKAVSTQHVPSGGAAWEYQLWGYEGAEPIMQIDYLNIRQNRS
jgi:hypothetical protein